MFIGANPVGDPCRRVCAVLAAILGFVVGSGVGWAQCQTELLASDGASSDFLGYSVALSGDVGLVGARLDDENGTNSGSVYVFRFNGSTWVEEQELLASDGAAFDFFGHSVAIDGDIAVVGAPEHDDSGYGSGSAYVFRFNGSSWVEEQKLIASDGAGLDYFGSSVTISGVVIVVGAYLDDDKGFASGSAYVFRFNGSSWIEEQKLLASDGAAVDYFGFSVAASGNAIVIGAYFDDDMGPSSGSAYVFRFNGSNWVQEQKLLGANGAAYEVFGYSVAVSGDLAVIGADQDDDNGINFGSTYVFRFNGSTWMEETELYGSDSATNDHFGWSVAVSDDMVLVGAYGHGSDVDSGATYLFRFNGSTWIEETKLLNANSASYDYFGHSVAASGDIALVGAFGDDDSSPDAGSAFVFDLTCAPSECTTNNDCNDADACTVDTCDAGMCSNAPVDCGDGNACTTDWCSGGSCQYTNNTSSCNDGNACTTNDVCSGGTCSGTLIECDDGVSCTLDSCTNGVCEHDNTSCDCLDSSDCADGNPCTTDICDVDGWCVNDLIGNCCGNGICEAAENPCNCSVDCDEPSPIESDCTNGLDDDCDGLIDENDSDCESACSPFGATCTNHSECCSGKCGSKRGAFTCKKVRRREVRRGG